MEELSSLLKIYGDVLEDELLALHTTYKVGGPAAYFVYPHSLPSLTRLIEILKERHVPFKVFGKGSNILASDDFFDGVVLCLDRYFTKATFEEEGICIAEAGASIIYVAFEAMKQGLSGLEFACGIPATVGGACYMNAGAYKCDMKGVVDSVLVMKEEGCCWLSNEECELGYRTSIFHSHPDWIVLAVKFKLTEKDPQIIKTLMDDRRERRMSTQPLDMPSAGSVFKNPPDRFVWQLIDELGLRGYFINGAQVSTKHPNFIVNANQASASDILALIHLIKTSVKEAYGIDLIQEVELFNWPKIQ